MQQLDGNIFYTELLASSLNKKKSQSQISVVNFATREISLRITSAAFL